MKKFKLFAVAFLSFLVFGSKSNGQFADSRLLLEGVPNMWNPASAPQAGWYLSFPAMGSHNAEVYNSGFRYNKVIHTNNNLDVQALFSELREINFVSARWDIQILQAGFKVDDIYFKFSLSEKGAVKFDYPENLFKLAWYGNGHEEFLGKTTSIGKIAFNSFSYTDLAFGFSMPVEDGKYRVGGNIHYLNGRIGTKTKKSDLTIYTDPVSYNIAVNGEYEMFTSGFDDADANEEEDIDFPVLGHNHGFAIDAGIEGEITDNITGSFQVNDLGFIRWRNNTYNYYTAGDFNYSGLHLNQLVDEENHNEEYFTNYLDSLEDELNVREYGGGFTTFLNTHINLTLGYHFDENHEVGFSGSYLRFFSKGIFTPSLFYRLKVEDHVGAFVQLGLYDFRRPNLNLGLWARGGPVVIHASLTHAPGMFNLTGAYNTGFSVGINFLFNRKGNETVENPE